MSEEQQIINTVDEMLRSVGLPTYTLLSISMAESNKIILSTPRAATPQINRVAKLPTETFGEWAVRYVDTYLESVEGIDWRLSI